MLTAEPRQVERDPPNGAAMTTGQVPRFLIGIERTSEQANPIGALARRDIQRRDHSAIGNRVRGADEDRPIPARPQRVAQDLAQRVGGTEPARG